MVSLNDIPKKIDEARATLYQIQDGHMGADVRHDRVRNDIAILDLELKIYQINSMDTLSKSIQGGVAVIGSATQSQEKQTGSLIFWTKIMAMAIVVQSIVLGVQVFLALQGYH